MGGDDWICFLFALIDIFGRGRFLKHFLNCLNMGMSRILL